MKKAFSFTLIFTITVLLIQSGCIGKCGKHSDVLSYINPYIAPGALGHTFPQVTAPFGMVQLSPYNGLLVNDLPSDHHYSNKRIIGFSYTHLLGTGAGDMYDVLITPVTKVAVSDTTNNGSNFMQQFLSEFSHKNESASPGYYSVMLEDSTKIELTASQRAGMQRFQYTHPEDARVIIDLGHTINFGQPKETHIQVVNDSLVTGYRFSENQMPDQYLFFAIRFSKPIHDFYFSDKGQLVNHTRQLYSERGSVIIEPNMGQDPGLIIKTGLSSVSVEGALNNLDTEIPDWNFDSILSDAQKTWRQQMEKVTIPSGNKKDKTFFYTSLYHSMFTPNLYSDANGCYRGNDGQIHQTAGSDAAVYISELTGQYGRGNEPVHPRANLYNYPDHSWKTKNYVTTIMNLLFYHDSPDGLGGNDDRSQITNGNVFSSIGFYPVIPPSEEYDLGRPLLPELTLNLPDGKTFTIKAKGLSHNKNYVESIMLNGKKLKSRQISYSRILQGGTLEFEMNRKPYR